MTTIRQALRAGAARLAQDEARAEAEILLAHALGADRTLLYARPERLLSPDEARRYDTLLAHRAEGWPVAYLTGRREFHGLVLRVTPHVLVPRHETELLVELALERIPAGRHARVADLGTGSGAIALALAAARPNARVVAVDSSEAALRVAADNARALGLSNVELRRGDWFEPLAGEHYALVVSNPPYLAEDDPHLDATDLRHEPRAALASGADGLDALRILVAGALAHLEPGGAMLVEHGADQGAALRALFDAAGYVRVGTVRDLERRERVTVGVRG